VMRKILHEDPHVDHTGEPLSMNCAEKKKLLQEKHKLDDKNDPDLEKASRQQAEEEGIVVEKI